jgi:hypothetical protein
VLGAKDNDVLSFGLRPQDDRLVAPGADEGERAVVAALAPWRRRLALEGLQRWLVRGASGAVGAACLVLAVGWLLPVSESELRPLALELAAVALLAAVTRGAWPVATARRASELDARLGLADRLATAWAERHATRPMAGRQRADALARLAERSPRRDLPLTWARREVGALAALTALAGVLLFAPSPMQGLLQQQAADKRAVEETATRLEVLRHEVAETPGLTPEQVRQLDELLQQAQRTG